MIWERNIKGKHRHGRRHQQKILGTLKSAPYSEPLAVYLLVQSYKLCERRGELDQFPAIRFFRNWACHARLSRGTATMFEKPMDLIMGGRKRDPTWGEEVSLAIKDSFRPFSFTTLRKELDRVARGTLGLKSNPLDWESFRRELYRVIENIAAALVQLRRS